MRQARRFIADRKHKGFTAIQLVISSHIYGSHSLVNYQGEPYVLDYATLNDVSRLNPRYFDYVDTLVQMANDSGMVVALVPLWASGLSELHKESWSGRLVTKEEGLRIAEYIGSRYAGHGVIWIVGGDAEYRSHEQQSYWTQVAERLHTACGRMHLATIHPKGFSSSTDFFDNTTSWLDFHAYQSSHRVTPMASDAALKGWSLQPVKPILNAEPVYEDIPMNFWNVLASKERAEANHVRQMCYMSILSGALVGISYGANGIWQWHTARMPTDHLQPRFAVDSAINFPGSMQMGVLRRVLERYQWHTMEPRQDLWLSINPLFTRIALAKNTHHILAYLPPGTVGVGIDASELGTQTTLRWINPVNGDSSAPQPATRLVTATTPTSSQDWLLLISKSSDRTDSIQTLLSMLPAKTVTVFPNPSGNSMVAFAYPSTETGNCELMVYDHRGLLLFRKQEQYSSGGMLLRMDMSEYSSGLYLYRLRVGTEHFVGTFSLVR
jgi:hypothetical protein